MFTIKISSMNLKQIAFAVITIATLGLGISSCKSQAAKDAAAKAKIESLLPGLSVNVKDGIATIEGKFPSEEAKAAAESTIRGIADIKTVVDSSKVETAATNASAPVGISPDKTLTDAAAAILKEYPGVSAAVKDGAITLTGALKKMDWMKLKPLLDGLHPKKVVNNLTINYPSISKISNNL